MSEKGCPKCNINYHMISDSCTTPMCKKCGGKVFHIDYEESKSDKILQDHMWSSNNATASDIDPNYTPK